MSDPVRLQTQIRLQNQAINRVNNGIVAATLELFENQVLPAAREMSPKRTGANADSLGVHVRRYRGKIRAAIFTESGHGGYLEKGTSKMAAEPYIYPAFERSLPALNSLLRDRIEQFSEIDTILDEGGIEGLAANLKSGEWKGKPASRSFPNSLPDERASSGWTVHRSGRVDRNALWKRFFKGSRSGRIKEDWATYAKRHGLRP